MNRERSPISTKPLAALALLLALSGCHRMDLEEEWRPITQVVERPPTPFTSAGTVTTYGSKLYVEDIAAFNKRYPYGSVDREALMRHEREHARRQFRYKGLPGEIALRVWTARYLTDADFMWAEEQAAGYLEITTLQKAGRWTPRDTEAEAYALSRHYKTIGGERMVSYYKAKQWILDVLSGKWKPKSK